MGFRLGFGFRHSMWIAGAALNAPLPPDWVELYIDGHILTGFRV